MTLAKNIFAELSPEELQGAMQAYNSYPNGYQGAMRRLSDWAKSNTGGMEPDVPEFTDSSFWEGVGIQVVRMVEEEQKRAEEKKIKNQTPSAPTERGPDDVPVMDPAMNQKTIDRLLDDGADGVHCDNPARARLLDQFLKAGGTPVGITGSVVHGSARRVRYEVFPEYQREPWALSYLQGLTERLQGNLDGLLVPTSHAA